MAGACVHNKPPSLAVGCVRSLRRPRSELAAIGGTAWASGAALSTPRTRNNLADTYSEIETGATGGDMLRRSWLPPPALMI